MKRRAFLGTMTGVIGALSGCTGTDESDPEQPTPNQTTTETVGLYETDKEGNVRVPVDITTHPDETPTPLPPDTCYKYDENQTRSTYTCHNNDVDSRFDSYYVKTWSGDSSNYIEVDFSNDLQQWYQFYSDAAGTYTWHGVRGTVTNTSTRSISLEVRTKFYTIGANGEYVPYGEARDILLDMYPGVKYPFDAETLIQQSMNAEYYEMWMDTLF